MTRNIHWLTPVSLELSQFLRQLQDYRSPIVGSNGVMTADFQRFLYGVIEQSETVVDDAQTAADSAQVSANAAQVSANTAQSSAENAAKTSSYGESNSPHFWYTDYATGNWPAGNPTKDLTLTFYDQTDAQIAQRVLRGTLTSAAGTIAVTNVSSSGLTTSYALSGDGTGAVKATVTVTLADGSKYREVLQWGTLDVSAAGEIGF